LEYKIKGRGDGMSVNDFANVGVFVIAMIGFALGTGLFGVLIVPDDWECIPLAAWLVGIFVYGLTVMLMWRW
jgi:hypothetical protein